MRLLLIRHGHYPLLDQALGGRGPHPLSAQGQAEAGKLADALVNRPVAAVVASPVQRAQETAAPIGARLGLPVQTDAAFTEIDFAGWTGLRFAELAGDPAWQAWNRFRGTAGVPGGETILQVQARSIAATARLAGAYPREQVAVVSHSDVIKVVLAHFLGSPLDLIRRLEIAPGSISEVELYPEDAKVLTINHRP